MVSLSVGVSENFGILGGNHQNEAVEEGVCDPGISDYELTREERIKENRERMQKLGIFDLSLKFRSVKPPNRAYRKKIAPGEDQTPLSKPGPVRRSSRLQNTTPVSYSESVPKQDKSINDDDLLREAGSKPEIYTEEHEKLLGSLERSWTLFVDGYGKDGKRIYDPVRGKTCHQCRQKTLGHRTNCCKCNLVQGQFCGDCLYMRYGEHVLEANENPNWICPSCRGICNCSLCRQAKGWAPTGSLYRKISSLGYKSVAHYLIKTRRANTDSDNNVGTKVPVSSDRPLPFTDVENTTGEDDLSKASDVSVTIDPPRQVDKEGKVNSESEPKDEHALSPEPKPNDPEYGMENKASTLFPGELDENGTEQKMATVMEPLNECNYNEIKKEEVMDMNNVDVAPEPKIVTKSLNDQTLESCYDNEIKKEETMYMDNDDIGAPEASPKSTKKRLLSQPMPDSIGARLRLRRNKCYTGEELKLSNRKKASRMAKTEAGWDSVASRLNR